jgi:hypothetical protein
MKKHFKTLFVLLLTNNVNAAFTDRIKYNIEYTKCRYLAYRAKAAQYIYEKKQPWYNESCEEQYFNNPYSKKTDFLAKLCDSLKRARDTAYTNYNNQCIYGNNKAIFSGLPEFMLIR